MRLQRAERLSETCSLTEGLFLHYRNLSFSPYHNNISRDKHFHGVIVASLQDDDTDLSPFQDGHPYRGLESDWVGKSRISWSSQGST